VAGGALVEKVFVRPDLEADQVQALSESTYLGGHIFLVLA
jgi:hypothetical protein